MNIYRISQRSRTGYDTYSAAIVADFDQTKKGGKRMKTDYPELEGKEVAYHYKNRVLRLRVSGCSYHIGITLQKLNGEYALCLYNSKLFAKQKGTPIFSPKHYRKVFQEIVKGLQQGVLNHSTLVFYAHTYASGAPCYDPSADNCPFS